MRAILMIIYYICIPKMSKTLLMGIKIYTTNQNYFFIVYYLAHTFLLYTASQLSNSTLNIAYVSSLVKLKQQIKHKVISFAYCSLSCYYTFSYAHTAASDASVNAPQSAVSFSVILLINREVLKYHSYLLAHL